MGIVAAIIAVVLGVFLLAFWIWMLVDCLRHEEHEANSRLIWALVIVLAELVGAIIYYFVRYRPRQTGAAA